MTVFSRRIVRWSGVLALAAILFAVLFYLAVPGEVRAWPAPAGREAPPLRCRSRRRVRRQLPPPASRQAAVITAAPGAFRFGVAGDLGGVGAAADSFAALAKDKPDFFLAIGDLSYDDIAPEKAWCNFVKEQLGDTYPFEVLVGNHEELPSSKSGFIDNFAKCLPDRLGEQGRYAHRYYFDYPADAPIARFIFIDPDLPRGEADAEYCRSGDKSNCNWLKEAHRRGAEPGLVDDREHAQGLHLRRGKAVRGRRRAAQPAARAQGGPGAAGARARLPADQAAESWVPAARSWSRTFTMPTVLRVTVAMTPCSCAGAGPVFVISAAFGQDPYAINLDDPELPYIALWMDRQQREQGLDGVHRHGGQH